MKLTYIYHSGFAIESDDFTIIIDFYKDTPDNIVYNKLLKKEGKLYVLSTHSHYDHFVPEILSWKEINPNITYIFSKDILHEGKAQSDDAIYLDKLETYKDSILSIKAFGSTDIGGSFLINTDNKQIFHAGDLNNWHWNEESTQEEIYEAESYYHRELKLLADEVKYLDLAMFPIDPRLGKDYMKGAQEFINTIKTGIFVPMHFDKAYEKIAKFEPYAIAKNCIYISCRKPGESINL